MKYALLDEFDDVYGESDEGGGGGNSSDDLLSDVGSDWGQSDDDDDGPAEYNRVSPVPSSEEDDGSGCDDEGGGAGGGAERGVSELLSSVTVKELQKELDARGLSKTGRKAALIQRLAEAMGDIDVVELEAMDMFNG